MKNSNEDFYNGILVALSVVATHDAETVFREIVNVTDQDELIRIARKNGEMRLSGLSGYGYGKKSDDRAT